MSTFRPTTAGEIAALLKKVPSKHCRLDPVPTWLVKQVSSVISPVITNMCNASFDQRVLPASQKKAITVPLLKKPTLDSSDLNSFRPISNLSFVSKIVERVADSRFVEHVEKNSLFPVFQSAYRVHYSTETALVRVHNDMVSVIDNGEVGGLVLLDMSSAFDTVDHQVMLDVLHRRFDVRDAALDWFRSYFSDRTQVVAIGSSVSRERSLTTGVPQGSGFGPRAYVAYSEDVVDVLVKHCASHHLFADDIQGSAHNKPQDASSVARVLEDCVGSVDRWCSSKRLQLNTRKTEVLWYGSRRNLDKLTPDVKKLHIGSDVIMPAEVVRDLGVYFDSALNMKSHISRTSRACFYHFRRLRAVRSRLGQDVATRLVCAFVISRLDYCNAVLAGLPASTLQPLQKVLNAAARLVLNLSPGEPTTSALRQLQ